MSLTADELKIRTAITQTKWLAHELAQCIRSFNKSYIAGLQMARMQGRGEYQTRLLAKSVDVLRTWVPARVTLIRRAYMDWMTAVNVMCGTMVRADASALGGADFSIPATDTFDSHPLTPFGDETHEGQDLHNELAYFLERAGELESGPVYKSYATYVDSGDENMSPLKSLLTYFESRFRLAMVGCHHDSPNVTMPVEDITIYLFPGAVDFGQPETVMEELPHFREFGEFMSEFHIST